MPEPYLVYKLTKKIYEERVLTYQGVYPKGEVPSSYSGPEMEFQFVQRMIFSDSKGNILELRLDDNDTLKDSNDNEGVGYSLNMEVPPLMKDPRQQESLEGQTEIIQSEQISYTKEPTNESVTYKTEYKVKDAGDITDEERLRSDYMYSNFYQDAKEKSEANQDHDSGIINKP